MIRDHVLTEIEVHSGYDVQSMRFLYNLVLHIGEALEHRDEVQPAKDITCHFASGAHISDVVTGLRSLADKLELQS